MNTRILLFMVACLVGCASDEQAVPKVQPTQASITHIQSLKFNLPKQFDWQAEQGRGKNVTVFSLRFNTPSPVKVIYQKLESTDAPAMLATKVMTPLRNNCHKSALSLFKTKSQYPQQINHEVLCNQVKGSEFGMVSYLNLFSAGNTHHMLIAEIMTPKSEKIGELHTVDDTLVYIKTLQEMMVNVTVCGKNGVCL